MKDELREAARTADFRYGKINHEYDDGFDAGYEAGKPKWIPVSERLPVDANDYIVTDIDGTSMPAWWNFRRTRFETPDDDAEHIQAVAWQPLPEPYTEGE